MAFCLSCSCIQYPTIGLDYVSLTSLSKVSHYRAEFACHAVEMAGHTWGLGLGRAGICGAGADIFLGLAALFRVLPGPVHDVDQDLAGAGRAVKPDGPDPLQFSVV